MSENPYGPPKQRSSTGTGKWSFRWFCVCSLSLTIALVSYATLWWLDNRMTVDIARRLPFAPDSITWLLNGSLYGIPIGIAGTIIGAIGLLATRRWNSP